MHIYHKFRMITYDKLLAILKERGISQRSVYRTLNISYSCWNGYTHKNKGMRTDTVNKLCALLDVQPGEILTYVPDPADFDAEVQEAIIQFKSTDNPNS